jgi:hypothetical protein
MMVGYDEYMKEHDICVKGHSYKQCKALEEENMYVDQYDREHECPVL